ncbi:MAG: hypothetical protein KF832_18800 [Caldilineaceae bacterium]|nr:hypothetical protein [Caldilineaceae bacterium]
MQEKRLIKLLILGGLFSLWLLMGTGCSVAAAEKTMGQEADQRTSTAQDTTAFSQLAVPTATPVRPSALQVVVNIPPAAPATATTVAPTPTPAPTVTQRVLTITGNSVNLRSGPGTDMLILQTANAGERYEFLSQDATGEWYQVCCVSNTVAWVYAPLAQLSEVPTTASQPTPTAPAFGMAVSPAPVRPTNLTVPLPATIFTQESVTQGERYTYPEQGFALTLPPTWQPFDLSTTSWQQAMEILRNANPAVATLVQQQLESYVNARFNFFAIALPQDLLSQGYITTVNLWKQPLPANVGLDLYAEVMAQETQTKFALTTPITPTALSLATGQGRLLSYQINGGSLVDSRALQIDQYLVMHNQTVYAFTFTTTADQADTATASFAAMVESFQLLN